MIPYIEPTIESFDEEEFVRDEAQAFTEICTYIYAYPHPED